MRGLFAFLLLLFAVPAQAEERTREFRSDVRIAADGTLTVAETIKVSVEGEQVRRGIERDFPTRYRNRLGQSTRVGFDVVSVTRDGQPEPYTLSNLSNGKRVRIGRADVLLDHRDHVFVLTYRTSRQLIFGKEFDELYWNATPLGWRLPINFASARITLPTPARFGQRAAYTGAPGSTERAAEVWDEGPGFIAFRTTRPLGVGEGLTVAAAFPKGVVTAPGEVERAGWWLQDWGPLGAALLAVAGLLAYQLRAWWVAGRGPGAGPVVPQFSPPDGLSAAACRYVVRMGMDDRCFTAAIVQAGVAGQLRIAKRDGGWFASDTTTLTPTGTGTPPDAAGKEMLDALFERQLVPVELKQENHKQLRAARTELADALQAAYRDRLFVANADWAVAGLLAIPVAMLAVAIVAALVGASAPGLMFGFPLFGLVAAIGTWFAYRFTRGQTGCLLFIAWAVVVGCAVATISAVFSAIGLALAAGVWAVLLPLVTLPVALLAFLWMKAPTREGRGVMDRIAGFEHYLGVTEEERLETLHPPEKTPELFERYLPYAIALGVENRWADRFATVLAAAAATHATGSAMSWYSGGGNAWDDPGGFADSVGSSLNSAVSSAVTAPSSSGGGSGGGGSSGGGGGGGGGGGW